ncbi:MAG: response regulator [Dehalococcoidales bacterium]|nr:MAG: response regulator [Dehalococcoidales bacterium]
MKNEHSILVVDDEIHMCEVLKRLLKKAGYYVFTASDGKKALNITRERKPDVILLDLMMPGMNGREVCQIVRKMSPDTKVIYLTAKVESDLVKLKEIRNEADTFIAKPATSNKILSSIENVLHKVV